MLGSGAGGLLGDVDGVISKGVEDWVLSRKLKVDLEKLDDGSV